MLPLCIPNFFAAREFVTRRAHTHWRWPNTKTQKPGLMYPTLCTDGRAVNMIQIKHLDGRYKPATTPHVGSG